MLKKTIMTIVCLTALLLPSTIVALAAESAAEPTVIRVEAGSPYFSVNGVNHEHGGDGFRDPSPFICSEFSRLMIPSGSPIFGAMGIDFVYSSHITQVFFTQTHHFEIPFSGTLPDGMGNARMTRPEASGGRLFYPLRAIAEGIGANVEWKSGAAYITLHNNPPPSEGTIPININRRSGNDGIIFISADFLSGEEVLIGILEGDYYLITAEVSTGEYTITHGGGSLLRFQIPADEPLEEVTVTLNFLPFRFATFPVYPEERVISDPPRLTMREVVYTETSVSNFTFARGELIVIAAQWYTYETMEALANYLNGEIVGYLEIPNTFQLYFPAADEAELQALQNLLNVFPFFLSVTFNIVF